MMTLYHGSNVEISKIDLSMCKKGKDFGKGFYLNPNFEQARGMACRAVRIMRDGKEIINAFAFDDKLLTNNGLRIKIFADYSEEWAEFIVANRKNKTDIPIHDYDIIIGPIADDSVGVQVRRYIQGYLPVSKLVEELRYHGDHSIQYFFGTERAIKLLKPI